MSSLTGNHTMNLFYLLKENFKNLIFNLLITGTSFENLSYLSSCSLSQSWRFRRIRSNVLRYTESVFAYTKVSGVSSQYILRSRSLWHPLSSSMLENKRIFSLVISKLMPAFCLWLYRTWCSLKSYQLIHHQRIIWGVWEESLYCLACNINIKICSLHI